MGFTLESLGLAGERITAKFGEIRDRCPHKGMDVSSSQKPKDFTAGIYGRVSAPLGGDWGTITVIPFNSPKHYIQYLHCSKIYVATGDIVAPWTTIGMTGKVAPSGTNISGIHLHLQVEIGGRSPHNCWKKRNFTDPQTWSTSSPLVGTWTAHLSNNTASSFIRFDILEDRVGANVPWIRQNVWVVNGCTYTMEQSWPDTIIQKRSGDGSIFSNSKGLCSAQSNCHRVRCTSPGSTVPLKLLSPTELIAPESGVRFSKASRGETSGFSMPSITPRARGKSLNLSQTSVATLIDEDQITTFFRALLEEQAIGR